MRVAKMTS